MESLNKLNEAVKTIIDIANTINDDATSEIFNKAPVVVHQRFCSELVKIAKENPLKTPAEIPEAMKVLTAINILEDCYPQLKHA